MPIGVYIRTEEAKQHMSMAHMGHVESVLTRARKSAANWKGGPQMVIARRNHKRRALGWNPLNSWFVGCEGHHINKNDVIYTPIAVHKSIRHNVFTGRNMDKINTLVKTYALIGTYLGDLS